MLRKVKLYGELAKIVGHKELEAKVDNISQSIRFLTSNFPKTERYIANTNFKVLVGDYQISEKELEDPIGKQDLHFVPVITGAGGEVRIRIYPKTTPTDIVLLTYVRKPRAPRWTYIVSAAPNHTALYNAADATLQNFELEPSEESELVNRILSYAGITIQKPELTQVASGLEGNKVQQEKQ